MGVSGLTPDRVDRLLGVRSVSADQDNFLLAPGRNPLGDRAADRAGRPGDQFDGCRLAAADSARRIQQRGFIDAVSRTSSSEPVLGPMMAVSDRSQVLKG